MFGVLLESLVVEPTEGGIGYENTCFPSWWLVEPTPFEKICASQMGSFPQVRKNMEKYMALNYPGNSSVKRLGRKKHAEHISPSQQVKFK